MPIRNEGDVIVSGLKPRPLPCTVDPQGNHDWELWDVEKILYPEALGGYVMGDVILRCRRCNSTAVCPRD